MSRIIRITVSDGAWRRIEQDAGKRGMNATRCVGEMVAAAARVLPAVLAEPIRTPRSVLRKPSTEQRRWRVDLAAVDAAIQIRRRADA